MNQMFLMELKGSCILLMYEIKSSKNYYLVRFDFLYVILLLNKLTLKQVYYFYSFLQRCFALATIVAIYCVFCKSLTLQNDFK
jgi:hypothetical protein